MFTGTTYDDMTFDENTMMMPSLCDDYVSNNPTSEGIIQINPI